MYLVRIFEIYYLGKFQVYNALLLTIVTTPYIRAPERTHPITESLHPLINSFPSPYPQTMIATILLPDTVGFTFF